MTVFGSMASAPILTNYLIESYTQFPAECAIVMNAYRLTFGLCTTFFIDQWADAVGTAWAFGTAGFLCIFAFLFVILLMWKGAVVRRIQWSNLASSNEGTKLMEVEKVQE